MRRAPSTARAALVLAVAWAALTGGTAAAGTTPAAATRAGLGTDVVGTVERCTGPAPVCPDRVLVGLSTPQVLALDGRLTGLEDAVGRRADLVGSYQDFTEPIYTARLRRAIASGRTPMVTWEPFRTTRPTAAAYPLARIAAGRYDGYLREAAAQAAAVGSPFILRFGHEMNGFWYPWGQPRPLHPQSVADPANTPAAYVRAYRHVVDVFRAAGATNVVWMWSPNVTDANPKVTLASLYPGDAYVDVIGLDGYLEEPADTVEARFRSTFTELATLGPGKPVIVAETGAVRDGGRPAALRSLVDALSAEPRVVGIVLFSQPDKAVDYRLEGDEASLAALRAGLRSPRFTVGLDRGGVAARTPVVTGTPRVGATLTARWTWRGAPDRAVGTWLSCPAAESPLDACTRLGWGSRLPLDRAVRGRYVRPVLGVLGAGASDVAAAPALGPVLTVPAAPAAPGVDLLAASVRLRLPAPAEDVTRWRLVLDDGAPTHLPVTTTTHDYLGLAEGTRHTVRLAALDGDAAGAETTSTFTVLTRPPEPAYTTTADGFVVTLPDPSPGQTGWVVTDGESEEELPLTTTEVVRTGLASHTSHPFGLRRVAGDGRTGTTFVYPWVP